MTRIFEGGVSRRSVLKLAVVSVSALGVVGSLAPMSGAAASVPTRFKLPPAPSAPLATDGNPRFQFQPISTKPGETLLGSLNDVWSSPRYTSFTDCVVTYTGTGAFELTDDEQAIVNVVGNAGGDVSNPQFTYLTVVAATTRMDPPALDSRLAQLGAPIVAGSIALAPNAPQGLLFQSWLAANG
jgi:hypothetical protein